MDSKAPPTALRERSWMLLCARSWAPRSNMTRDLAAVLPKVHRPASPPETNDGGLPSPAATSARASTKESGGFSVRGIYPKPFIGPHAAEDHARTPASLLSVSTLSAGHPPAAGLEQFKADGDKGDQHNHNEDDIDVGPNPLVPA